eukprot:scaffold6655_cov169-Amphora_coffeaeformis.AAC.29
MLDGITDSVTQGARSRLKVRIPHAGSSHAHKLLERDQRIVGSVDPRHDQDARLPYSPHIIPTYLVELSSIMMMECSNPSPVWMKID